MTPSGFHTYRVSPHTQVNRDGTVYGEGETFEAVEDDDLADLRTAGIVVIDDAPAAKKRAK